MNDTPADYVTRIFDKILLQITDSALVARVMSKTVHEDQFVWAAEFDMGLSGALSIEIRRMTKGWCLSVDSNQNPKRYELETIDDVERMFWNPQLLMV